MNMCKVYFFLTPSIGYDWATNSSPDFASYYLKEDYDIILCRSQDIFNILLRYNLQNELLTK